MQTASMPLSTPPLVCDVMVGNADHSSPRGGATDVGTDRIPLARPAPRSDRRRPRRHRHRRLHRHAGPTRRQARLRPPVPRGRRRARRRGVQLPARRRRRDEHRRRLRDVELGARLRRHGAASPTSPRSGPRRGSTATALVTADLQWLDGTPVEASPRRILQRQLERLAERGLDRVRRHRARVHRLRRHLPRRLAQGLPRPDAGQRLQHRLRAARVRRAWSRCCATSGTRWTAPACTARASRASATSASRRSPSATPTRSAPATTTRSTRTARRRSPTGTARRSPSWRSSTSARATAATSTSRLRGEGGEAVFGDADAAHGMSTLFRHFLAGPARGHARAHALLRAERQLLQALRRRAASPRPRSPGASTTAPARCGSSATALGMRVENRVPGGDVNQYLAVAALIAAGLHGIDQELEPGDVFVGNAYESDVARVPRRCASPPSCSRAPRSRARPSATRSSSTT